MCNLTAIALLGSPSASSSSTCTSRGVSGSSTSSSSTSDASGVMRIASQSESDARAAASESNSPATSIDPFSRARSCARSDDGPTSRILMRRAFQNFKYASRDGPLSHCDVQLGRLAASQHLERHRPAHTVAEQKVEQLLGRLDVMSIEVEDEIADEDTCRRRGTPGGHAHDQQRLLASI